MAFIRVGFIELRHPVQVFVVHVVVLVSSDLAGLQHGCCEVHSKVTILLLEDSDCCHNRSQASGLVRPER